MNEVNGALENWKDLLRRIREDKYVHLSDFQAHLYDFNNELLMQVMSERLIELLETAWTNPKQKYYVDLGNKFFASMNEQQQRSFLRRIVALPVHHIIVGDATNNCMQKPAITIHTAALLDALTDLRPRVLGLYVGNFALSDQSDVEAMSSIILAKHKTLARIRLTGIECPITNNKRDRDGPIGFLDPLLYAVSRSQYRRSFELVARTSPSHLSLVSTNAVRALFSGRRMDYMGLEGLCLNDSHCHAIAEALRTSGMHINRLHLRLNPAISAQGYGALLAIMNWEGTIGDISVDDATWGAKLNLVSEMNQKYGRLEYMTDGAFSSDERRWQWLNKLASLRHCSDEEDAKQINFIWYELVEHPQSMQT